MKIYDDFDKTISGRGMMLPLIFVNDVIDFFQLAVYASLLLDIYLLFSVNSKKIFHFQAWLYRNIRSFRRKIAVSNFRNHYYDQEQWVVDAGVDLHHD